MKEDRGVLRVIVCVCSCSGIACYNLFTVTAAFYYHCLAINESALLRMFSCRICHFLLAAGADKSRRAGESQMPGLIQIMQRIALQQPHRMLKFYCETVEHSKDSLRLTAAAAAAAPKYSMNLNEHEL